MQENRMKSYTIEQILDQTVYTATIPRRRQSLDTLALSEQHQAKRFYAVIRPLVEYLQTNEILPQSMVDTGAKTLGIRTFELVKKVRDAYYYWETYPDDAPEQAFTPVARSTKKQPQRTQPRQPRRRPHLLSITDEKEKEQIIIYTADIVDLVEQYETNGGRLPSGALSRVAQKWGKKPITIEKHIQRLIDYRYAHGHEPDGSGIMNGDTRLI